MLKPQFSGKYLVKCKACSYERKNLDAHEVDERSQQHGKEKPGHGLEYTEQLSPKPQVGDKVRLVDALAKATKDAYDIDISNHVYRVTSEYDRRVYGEVVLRLDASPWQARPNQVELAWRNDAERRAGLLAWQAQGAKAS